MDGDSKVCPAHNDRTERPGCGKSGLPVATTWTQKPKSGLVGRSWNELNVDTRRSILRDDLEKMLETYGGQSGMTAIKNGKILYP